jgi:hypothetical protein
VKIFLTIICLQKYLAHLANINSEAFVGGESLKALAQVRWTLRFLAGNDEKARTPKKMPSSPSIHLRRLIGELNVDVSTLLTRDF